jgi:hypothetical protein
MTLFIFQNKNYGNENDENLSLPYQEKIRE